MSIDCEIGSGVGKPSGCLLIINDLGVGVPAETQGQDKNPGFGDGARENILDIRPFAKVDLSCLTWFKLQNAGDGFFMVSEFLRQTSHGGVTARKTIPVGQCPLDGSQANAVAKPGFDLFLVVFAF